MKGQIFLITAVFIVILVVLLRVYTMEVPDLEKYNLYNDFVNLKAEYSRVVDTSLLNSQNITNNLDEFSSFAEDYYKEKGIDYTVSYDVNITGSDTVVDLDIYLSDGKSYLSDEFTIERTVY